MSELHFRTIMARRELLARLTTLAASVLGVTAFSRAPLRLDRMPVWDDAFELAVDLEIATQDGFRSHRPYVAIWVEDANGKPVRTLSLWVNTTGRGPRYIRELRQWFDEVRGRAELGDPDLIETTSSATRPPGRYSVTWNGRDDHGQPVQQGVYRVLIEAAREHGTYQLMQQEMTLRTQPTAAELGGNQEIRSARVEYRRIK